MVREPLLFFFSSLLAVAVVVRLLVTIAAHCRERLRHTHTTRCEYGPRLGRQRERERAMAASVSSIFFTFDVVNAACSSPHLLLCSPYFVSSAKLIAKSIFYLATFERGAYLASLSRACTCNWRCWHIAFGLPDVSKYGRCCCSPLFCSVLFYLFLHRVRPSFRWLSFGFCLFDCVINHMSWLSLLSRFVAHFRQINTLTHQDVCIHTHTYMYVNNKPRLSLSLRERKQDGSPLFKTLLSRSSSCDWSHAIALRLALTYRAGCKLKLILCVGFSIMLWIEFRNLPKCPNQFLIIIT